MDECRIDGCELPVFVISRQLCQGHYQQMHRAGLLSPRPKRACDVIDCDRPVISKDLCEMHYRRLRRSGRLERLTLGDRFWRYVDKRAPGECWPWTGAMNREGYGTLRSGAGHVWAHRVSYELNVGPIPEGMQIDHLCRVTNCVNPAHMEPVTQRVNILRSNNMAARWARREVCDKCGGPFTQYAKRRVCLPCMYAKRKR